MHLSFFGIPLPPTVNQIYAGKSRRYKSPVMKEWERAFELWWVKNQSSILGTRNILRDELHSNSVFVTLSIDFHVHRSKLYSKTGEIKKNDCTNRIKPLLDAIAEVLGIDDCRYFLASVEWCIYDDDEPPWADVQFGLKRIKENVKRT